MQEEVLLELKSEHQQFLKTLESIELEAKNKNYFNEVISLSDFRTKFLQLSHEVSTKHHEKEEKLFETLITNKKVNHGGPKCDFFMAQRMIHSDSEKINQLWKSYSSLKHLEGALLTKGKNLGSALAIPLEEHELLKKLVMMLEKEVSYQLETLKPENAEKIIVLFNLYSRLLKEHIAKEDQCLFEMIKAF